MNNYISAGLAIAKVVGVTVLVALAIAALIFVLTLIYIIVATFRDKARERRQLVKTEKKLEEAWQKLLEVGAFMDILKKQSGVQNGTNEQK